jgi:hypothetical protein
MYIIKFYCGKSGMVFTETEDTLEEAQKRWDNLEFKRHIYMHTPRPV